MNFKDRLLELSNGTKISKIVADLNLSSGIFYQWKNGVQNPSLDYLIKLANYFECSLDYLLGRTEDNSKYKAIQSKSFYEQFEKIIEEKGITKYQLVKQKIISKGNQYDWEHDKSKPSMDNLIKLADYLNVSVDHLVGRE